MIHVYFTHDTLPILTNAELEKEVDEDIKQFSSWFCDELKNDPLMHVEKAILKTYLAYKLGVGKKQG